MKQFNLQEWLQNKERKVVTRCGSNVRIVCWDRKHGEDDLPIVALVDCEAGEFLICTDSNGCADPNRGESKFDLFFQEACETCEKHMDKIKEYLQEQWKFCNHPKYYKYFEEWYANITGTQMMYFKCWSEGNKSPYC